MPRYGLRRLILLLLFPISFVAVMLAAKYPALTERYFSQGLYAIIAPALTTLTGLFFVSIAELALIVGVLSLILYTVRTIRIAMKDKTVRVYTVYTYVVNLLVLAAVLYGGFVFLCGLNYHRLPFAENAHLTVRESSSDELVALCKDLASTANRQAQFAISGEDGTTVLSVSDFDTANTAVYAMKGISKDYPFMRGMYSVPKPFNLSPLLSYTHISGFYFPFTFEANYNTAIPDFYLPATMCHELAHQHGYMREDEANFIAYLACRNSQDAYFNYSGTLHALSFAMQSLSKTDSETYQQIYASLDDRIQADFAAYNSFWNRHKGAVSQVSTSVNNAYLKANHQADGVQSYGRMVDLLLADYRQRHELA